MKKRLYLVIAGCLIGLNGGMLFGVEKPLMHNGQEVGHIDLDEQDPMLRSSFQELIEQKMQEGRPFIIARILSLGENVPHYFSAQLLNDWLFKDGGLEGHEYENLITYDNPYNNRPIVSLEYFEIPNVEAPAFEYLCNFDDLAQDHSNQSGERWRDYFNENEPHEAMQGPSAKALYEQGLNFLYGDEDAEIAVNYGRARRRFERVSQQEEDKLYQAYAFGKLAEIYERGHGVQVNEQRANALYEQERNVLTALVDSEDATPEMKAEALDSLGHVYYSGAGVAQDYNQAGQYFNQGINLLEGLETEEANTMRIHALWHLAQMYHDGGPGIDQDYAQSRIYYDQILSEPALEPFDRVTALAALGEIYMWGDMYNFEQNYALARDYYRDVLNSPDAEENQIEEARLALGRIYFAGDDGVQKDYAQARDYLAALLVNPVEHLNVVAARGILGEIYFEGGYGVQQDYAQALIYLNQVISDPEAMSFNRNFGRIKIAEIYMESGHGVPQDYAQALNYLNQVISDLEATSWNRREAGMKIAEIYTEGGHGVPQDYAQALNYLNQVISDPEASYLDRYAARLKIAEIYMKGGHGVQKNYAQALIYLNQIMSDPEVSDLDRMPARMKITEIYMRGGHGVERDSALALSYMNQ